MTKLLVELLQAKEPLFSHSLDQLEKVAGKPGVDAKLVAEIIQSFKSKVKDLGLDPEDSTGEEIYAALIQKAKQSDLDLAKKLGISDPEDVEEARKAVLTAISEFDMPRQCWALKEDVAKKMLQQMPPKNIMERLGYKNVDDMLKKENLYEVYGALRFAEEGEWLNEFNKMYETLTPDDFETRSIKLVVMPKSTWGDVASHFVEKKRHLNTHLKELGVVMILPASVSKMAGITTKLVSLTFHYYNEVRLYSAFFKTLRNKPDFGKIFVETLIADTDTHAVLAGQNIHWRVIQRYFGKLDDEYHPEVFEPHVQPEDLHWRKAEEMMYELDPSLLWWKDLDYVGLMYGSDPLTMNFIDVSLSYSNDINYEERYIYHFRESLWNEVFIRYMGEKILEEQILRQLDNDMIEPEEIKL